MKRTLQTQKLSDEALKNYIKKIEFLVASEKAHSIKDDEILTLANIWYDNHTEVERLILLSIELWKEVAF